MTGYFRLSKIAALVLSGAALCPKIALAGRNVAPGVTYSYGNGYHVVVADTGRVRVAAPRPRPADNIKTVARRAAEENALVAINANFFGGPLNHPCGAARGGGAQAQKCPADCGSACVQPVYPPVAQCLGKPCRAGLGSTGSCDITMTRLVVCRNGIAAARTCATVCMPDRSGGGSCAKCPSGNGLYCGGTVVSGEKGVLYRCAGGFLTEVRRCAKGCVRMPAGVNDRCE